MMTSGDKVVLTLRNYLKIKKRIFTSSDNFRTCITGRKHRLRFIQINFQHHYMFCKFLTERSKAENFYTQPNYPQLFSYKRYRQALPNMYDYWSINQRKREAKPPQI